MYCLDCPWCDTTEADSKGVLTCNWLEIKRKENDVCVNEGNNGVKTWHIYEKISPIVGKPYEQYVGSVDAKTEAAALNKAAKLYKVDRGGVPVRRRRAENFVAR